MKSAISRRLRSRERPVAGRARVRPATGAGPTVSGDCRWAAALSGWTRASYWLAAASLTAFTILSGVELPANMLAISSFSATPTAVGSALSK